MDKIIFHCGAFKTGSSCIQNAAYHARRHLKEAGWLYPVSGLQSTEPEVGYRHTPLVYDIDRLPVWKDHVRNLLKEIETSGCNAVLLSSEAWSRPVAFPVLKRLVDVLRKRTGASLEGFIYLRDRADYARSLYREFCRRRGNGLPFSEFIQANKDTLDLVKVVTGLSELFEGRLICRRYDRDKDICKDFFSCIGAPYIPLEELEKRNMGINAVEAEVRRIANALDRKLSDDFPGVEEMLEEAGVRLDLNRFVEIMEDNYVVHRGARRRLQSISRLSKDDVEAIFCPDNVTGIDISLLSPLLEALVSPWLESRQNMQSKTSEKKKEIWPPRKLYWRFLEIIKGEKEDYL